MRAVKSTVAYTTLFALLLWMAPLPALAQQGGARLEGLLVGIDGRPANDMTVHLIDGQGNDVAQAATSGDGLYSFQDLPPGNYSLGIENPAGQMAPVAAPPVKLGGDELARRDLQMLQSDPAAMSQATSANYGLGTWWAGLSGAAKAWTIVAIVAVVGITAAAVSSSEDSKEQDGSPATY